MGRILRWNLLMEAMAERVESLEQPYTPTPT